MELARRLDVDHRVVDRIPREQLHAELGDEAAKELVRRHLLAAGNAVEHEAICRLVAGVADELESSCIFLKGAALLLGGFVGVGRRTMGDVDVLVCRERAQDFRNALVARGCTELVGEETETEMPPLVLAGSTASVDLHLAVRGLRLGGGGFASHAEVTSRGVEPAPGVSGGHGLVPSRDVLIGHALVHGLVQHGMAPDTYPLCRMLSDLHDLGLDDGSRFIADGYWMIAEEVRELEVEAAAGLLRRLERGESPEVVMTGEGGESRLLRHVVLGSLETSYSRSLRWQHLTRPMSSSSRAQALWRKMVRRLRIPAAALERRYGPAETRLQRVGDRVRWLASSVREVLVSWIDRHRRRR